MTVREVLKLLHKDGWYEVENRTKGSHTASSSKARQGDSVLSWRGYCKGNLKQHPAAGRIKVKLI